MRNIIYKILILIVISLSGSLFTHAQKDEWVRVIGEDKEYVGYDMIETYDNGYLLSGQSMSSTGSVEYGLLIKTDINGEVLWEKMVGANPPPGKSGTLFVKQLADGGYIISGSTYIYGNYSNAFILKLNVCGEKEWSKIFYNVGSTEYGVGVDLMEDGTYLSMIKYWGNDLYNDRIWLFNIDQEGEIIWQKVYAKWTLGTNSEEGKHLLKNDNNEYLITGSYYQYNPGEDTTQRYVRPMFIQIDSLGNEMWHQLWGVNDYFYGSAHKSAYHINGSIYSVGNNKSYNIPGIRPSLFKLDNNGTQLYSKDLIEDSYGGGASTISIMEDSILFIGATWLDSDDIIHNGVIKTDTLGNIIEQKDLLNVTSSFRTSLITYDNKYLVTGSFHLESDWDIYLWKFNRDLEYDSIYTQPRIYDSLCPYPIVSDTIDLDTSTVNLQELYAQLYKIKVHPNPASSKLHITLGDLTKGTDLILYNTNGQAVKQIQLQDIKREYELNISDLPAGLYVLAFLDNGKIVDREKVVIQH
jgi:hypothetical protein